MEALDLEPITVSELAIIAGRELWECSVACDKPSGIAWYLPSSRCIRAYGHRGKHYTPAFNQFSELVW